MTYIISAINQSKKLRINPVINQEIKALHRKLVAISFSQGNHSAEYDETLKQINALRKAKYQQPA